MADQYHRRSVNRQEDRERSVRGSAVPERRPYRTDRAVRHRNEIPDRSRMAGRRRKVAYRKPQQNKISMFLVVFSMLVIVGVIAFSAYNLQKKIDAYDLKIQELETEIQREQERAEKIEEFRKYTQTKGSVEEIAQDKLGLVYDGEILFKQEK